MANRFAVQAERGLSGNDHQGVYSVDVKRVCDLVNREVVFEGEGHNSGQGVRFFED